MINFTDKKDCCGCGACSQKCPMHSISLSEDSEGFLYPKVDEETCIDCGLCEKICPILNPSDKREPQLAVAAINNDEYVRMKSSSGGIFSILAEEIIKEGGVVFGARFDKDWQVVIDYTETAKGIESFRGSKYVQARTGTSFKQCEFFLKEGRKVLFSGTPCQIAALNKYLHREYDNLLSIEVACHGVPSPLVWRDYLKIISNGEIVKSISFRDKTSGYRTYSTNYIIGRRVVRKYYKHDKYMLGFIHNLFLRPSCFKCPAKEGRSLSDLLIGDFWSTCNSIDDKKGLNLVLVYSVKGEKYLKKTNAKFTVVDYDSATKDNPCIIQSTKENSKADAFWEMYYNNKSGAIDKFTKSYMPNWFNRIKFYLHKMVN